MYICCLVMNTHLQKDAIKKIFSTLTMLMNEYEVSLHFNIKNNKKKLYAIQYYI